MEVRGCVQVSQKNLESRPKISGVSKKIGVRWGELYPVFFGTFLLCQALG